MIIIMKGWRCWYSSLHPAIRLSPCRFRVSAFYCWLVGDPSSPTAFRKAMNWSFSSAFVSLSATWSSVEMYFRSTVPAVCCSLTKWCYIAMCLVLAWNCGFFASAIAPWLSPKIMVALGSSSSIRSWDRSDCSHIASIVAWVWAMYSASQVEKDTVGWCFEDQLIAPLPISKTKPEIDLRVCMSPAQSASVYPVSGFSVPRNASSIWPVPFR